MHKFHDVFLRVKGPGSDFLDLGSTFWPGDILGVNSGSPKNVIPQTVLALRGSNGVAKGALKPATRP